MVDRDKAGKHMTKRTRALSGAAKDAYIERTIAAETEIGAGPRARLAQRLQREISVVAVRARTARQSRVPAPAPATAHQAAPQPFDPYSPNVVVVIRTRGREAVLTELQAIDDAERLRHLAREQQLGIAPELATPAEIRLAIVAAAERRIANRRAAAS